MNGLRAMHALYIGQLWHGGTCLERLRVLGEAGWTLTPFDITPYLRSTNRLMASMQHRLLWGPDVARFNRDVARIARTIGRLDVVWIDKGRWLLADVLDEIKMATAAIAVHYTPDPAFTVHHSRHFLGCLPYYELCLTTKRYEIETYARHGARETLFTLQGIDDRFERLHACAWLDGRTIDLMFIGHREPYYERVLAAARLASGSLRVHGPGWSRPGKKTSWRGVAAGPVWGDDYARALAQARIGLGLLSKMCPDAFTTRSFEIPASGAMLLAERTTEHQALFKEDHEAVFFGSHEELRDKISFYLRNEGARRAIAAAGRARALGQYHWRHVSQPAIRRTEEIARAR